MKNALFIVGMISILLVSSSVSYYYIFFLPAKQQESLELQKEKFEHQKALEEEEKRNKTKKEQDALAEKRRQELAEDLAEVKRQQDFDNCLSRAYENYNANWLSACQAQNEYYKKMNEITEKQNKQFEELTGIPHDNSNLYEYQKIDENCKLPTEKADKLGKDLEDSKDECIEYYKLGL
ncbi:hypothetical protein IPN35_04860 [Candidatus Peregrinibacteria bacterium]|nr:MAG: hypothetical protein IPN35_04860 [Candidatus Peregrinibacteria bacterium]